MSNNQGLFRQINNAVLDLQSAEHQGFSQQVSKLSRLLKSDELVPYNELLTANVDLEAFLKKGEESQRGMIGSASLGWPENAADELGLKLLLIHRFGENSDFMLSFAHHYYNSGSRKYMRDIQSVTSQLIVPFVRDYKAFVESQGKVDMTLKLPISNKVFIVHGHDAEARETVARFISMMGLDPVILHEQANRGRTVIEKVEANSDVGFAVVLLTPDDVGRAVADEELEFRARQNVLLELGYFIGKHGRDKVCALKRGRVSIPSDFAGVVWEDMDDRGAWKQSLARELEAAGHTIDWQKAMTG